MILPFKPQFVPRILSGRKIHTIREDKTNRWKPGNKIQMATGVRTKNYNCFKTAVCISVQTIEIKYFMGCGKFPIIKIDGELLDENFELALFQNDGFDSREDFFSWFDSDFKGKIIHWTYFKY